ncbi:MAG: ATP-binding protein [Pseudomonadota bacterium]
MSDRAFIDFAVMEGVRDTLLNSSPALLFDARGDELLWFNAQSAKLLGLNDEALDNGAAERGMAIAKRQIKASLSAVRAGRTRDLLLRFTVGVASVLRKASLSVTDADELVLVVLEKQPLKETSDNFADLLAMIGESGASAAIIDAKGAVLATNTLFEEVAPSEQELRALAAEVATEDDSLVKRQAENSIGGQVAVGIGRLSDGDDGRNLVLCVAVEDEAGNEPAISIPATADTPDMAEELLRVAEPVPAAEQQDIVVPDDQLPTQTADDEPTSAVASTEVDAAETPRKPPAETNVGFVENIGDTGEISPDTETFSFEPALNPIRFVWKMDGDGTFTEISEEFRKTVGPQLSDVVGKSFAEVSSKLKIDENGDIGRSISRRDTWSGKTVMWPVQGADLRVPVDLAALPYYNRDREFQGYRGFGVVRVSDAVIDPLSADVESLVTAPVGYESPPSIFDETGADETQTASEASTDPFEGEPPVLNSAQLPSRFVRDAEDDGDEYSDLSPQLTSKERAAFDAIGESLSRDAKPAETDGVLEGADIGSAAERPEDEPTSKPDFAEDRQAADELSAALIESDTEEDEERDETPIAISETAEAAEPVSDPDADDFQMQVARQAEIPPIGFSLSDEADQETVSDEASETESDIAPAHGLTADMIDELPLALLIVRDERAVFGNMRFQVMTGYDDIEDLNTRGGLGALIDGPSRLDQDLGDGESFKGAVTIVGAHDEKFPARAHMQIIPFEGQSAIMFAFDPLNEDPSQQSPYVRGENETEDPLPDSTDNVVAFNPIERGQPREVDANDVSQPFDVATKSAEIDEQNRAMEAELQDHIQELENIIDIASDGVIIVQTDGAIRSVNGPGRALFGYDRDDIEGKSFRMLFAQESQQAAMDYLQSLAGNGVQSVLNEGREVLGRERNGGFLPLFMTIARLPASSAYCAVIRDITQWKQNEAAMEQARKDAEEASSSKSVFLAKISHEIRTPLNSIIGFSDLMREERFGPLKNDRYKAYLADINKSGRHVLELVNDLLDISKIEAGSQELEFSETDLNEIARDVISMLQPQASANRVILRTNLSNRLPRVVADARSMRQVIINLLSNAVSFTPAGGLIVVGTHYERDNGLVVRIKDTGIGMTDKEIDLAMQPFKQVRENLSTERDRDGTGLGLPLTKALVEANRAEFTLHSEASRGTVVEIMFPESRIIH